MEQAGTDAAVPTVKKNGNSRRESGVKEIQTIRTFLEGVGIYEADALRMGIAIADGKVTEDNISADDRLALNRLSQQWQGQRTADGGERAGTSDGPRVRVTGTGSRLLRQATVSGGK